MQNPTIVRRLILGEPGKEHERKVSREGAEALASVHDYISGQGAREGKIKQLVQDAVYDSGGFQTGMGKVPSSYLPKVIEAIAHAFPREHHLIPSEASGAFEFARLNSKVLQGGRHLYNDTPFIMALMNLGRGISTDGIVGENYYVNLVAFLRKAIQRRFFRESPALATDQSNLSSAVAVFLNCSLLSSSTHYVRHDLSADCRKLVGENGVFFSPSAATKEKQTLEVALINQLMHKTISEWDLERLVRVVDKSLNG